MPAADGRRIGVRDYGDPHGVPLLYFHGHPGSCLDLDFVDPGCIVRRSGVRLIAVERPGYGWSDPQPGRSLASWPADVAAVADRMGVGRFSVLGYSGGGPFAVATAAALPNRVQSLLLVAAMGPSDAPEQRRLPGWALPGSPAPLRHTLAGAMGVASRIAPRRMSLAAMAAALPPCDRVALADPVVADGLLASWREAFRQGRAAAVSDAVIYTRPWPFDYRDVPAPSWIWHGTEDINVPLAVGAAAARELPHCTATFLEGEGHVSVWRELPQILEVARRPPAGT